MAVDPLLEPLAALLNRNLAASGQARGLAEALEGRSFAQFVYPNTVRKRTNA